MANQTGNGRNVSSEEDNDRERMYRDRDRDERFMQRDRERMGSYDDRSSRSWDRDDDRSVGWRSIDRGGMGQSGYSSGREGDRSFDSRSSGYPRSWEDRSRENYLAQGGQQMGNPWGNEMGHGTNRDNYGYDQNRGYQQQHGGYSPQGYMPSYQGGMSMGQPGMGSSYNQGRPYGGMHFGTTGYGRHDGQDYGQGYQGYEHSRGMGLGQHGNFRHQSYSHLGQQNFGHLGPEAGAHMSSGAMGDYGRDWNRGPEFSRGEWNAYDREPRDESLGQRIKHWLQGHRGKGPQGYQRSDERVREHVCEVLTHDDRVDASNIEVAVKNGEVTLSGTVNDRATKRLAEDCIEDISGVKDIQNNIRVISREMGRETPRGVGTGSSLETPTTGGNGADKRHRA
jgi:hypothetical protein